MAWLPVFLFLSAPAQGQQPWSLTGTVLDSITEAPIDGAQVRWVEEDRTVTTSEGGQFSIPDVHLTLITLQVAALGHTSSTTQVSYNGPVTVVTIRMGPQALQLSGLDVELSRARIDPDLSVPQSTTRLGRYQIIRDRGQTLGETLRGIEGVSVIQYGPSVAKPVIRGLHSQRIIVMNDGVRQEGQQWGGEHAPEIDVFGVNEIEVVRGPASVEYGSDALGGVLRIEPAALPYQTDLGGELAVNSFSNNRQLAGSAMVEHGRINLPVLGTMGARFRLSGRKAGDAGTADYNLTNTGFTELNFGTTIGAERPWGDIELDYSRFDTRIGLFKGAHVGNFDDLMRAMTSGPVPTQPSYAIESPRQEVTHDALRLEGHFHLQDLGQIESSYGFQLNRRREYDNHGPLANRVRPAFGLDLYTHTLESKFNHEEIAGLRGTIGIMGMRQGNISTGKAFLIPQYRLYSSAIYLLEEVDVGRVTLSGGVRYEYRWQHIYEFTDAAIDVPDETKVYDGMASSVGISIPFGNTWSISGSAGRAWRAPNVNERYSQGIHHGTAQYELGDPFLTTERTWNVDTTLKRAGARLGLQVSGFRNAVLDYIYLEPREPVLSIRGAYPAFGFRQTDAVLRGIDASITAQLLPSLQIYTSGSLVRGTDDRTGEPLYDMPADRIQLGTQLALGGTSWAVRPFADLNLTVVREQVRVPQSTIYALPTEGYRLVNLELGVSRLAIGGRPFEIGLEVRNLFNVSHRDYLSRYKLFVDDPGRDIVIRAQMPLRELY